MASKEPLAASTASDGRCPICGASTEIDYRPFCSGRCRDVDLSRWLRGAYAIPGGQADADEDGEDTSAMHATQSNGDDDGQAAD